MDAATFTAVQAQVVQWLTELTGEQLEQLRERFDRCTSLADCLAIIEQRGAAMRHCPHCQATNCTATACFTACSAIAAVNARARSTR